MARALFGDLRSVTLTNLSHPPIIGIPCESQAMEYCETSWFWTDQFATNVQIVGVPASYDGVVVRGRREDNRFSVLPP